MQQLPQPPRDPRLYYPPLPQPAPAPQRRRYLGMPPSEFFWFCVALVYALIYTIMMRVTGDPDWLLHLIASH